MTRSMNTWPETFPKVHLIGELSVWFADLGHLVDRPCVREELAFRSGGARLVYNLGRPLKAGGSSFHMRYLLRTNSRALWPRWKSRRRSL